MKFLFVYVMIMFSIYACCGGSCVLKLNKHLPKANEPLYLTNRTEFLYPKKQNGEVAIVLNKDEEILMACPGPDQVSEVTPAFCQSGNSFKVLSKVLKSEELFCRRRPKPSLKITGKPCAEWKSLSLELGYLVKGVWLPLVEICHNVSLGQTYYSRHELRGSLIQGKETGCERPKFSKGSKFLYPGYSPHMAYLQSNQRSVLTKLVGRKADNLLNVSFLSCGHLSPDADFLFSTHQAATYFYVNAAPQWQTINQGKWLSVEKRVRELAEKLGDDFEVWTGTHGVLKIQDDNHAPHEMRLHDPSLPVPEFFWKIVRNTRDDSCIVLVVTNDPFSADPQLLERCKEDCPEYHWPEFEDDPRTGIVRCCEYKQLKSAVPYHPELNCTKPLNFQ